MNRMSILLGVDLRLILLSPPLPPPPYFPSFLLLFSLIFLFLPFLFPCLPLFLHICPSLAAPRIYYLCKVYM